MPTNDASLKEQIHIRARYLWDKDGQPERRLSDYWPQAREMLKNEAAIAAPVDEATAAGLLLRKPLYGSPVANRNAIKEAARPAIESD